MKAQTTLEVKDNRPLLLKRGRMLPLCVQSMTQDQSALAGLRNSVTSAGTSRQVTQGVCGLFWVSVQGIRAVGLIRSESKAVLVKLPHAPGPVFYKLRDALPGIMEAHATTLEAV